MSMPSPSCADRKFADLIDTTTAAKLLPGRVSTTTIWRWTTKGRVLADGTRVKLRTVRVGSRPFTTSRWLRDFIEIITSADASAREKENLPRPRAARRVTDRQRQASHEAAEARLAAAGL